jgi:hypothetical protein
MKLNAAWKQRLVSIEPVDLLCSRNAHDARVLVRRAQGRAGELFAPVEF